MTRQEMKGAGADLLLEYPGTPAGDNPIGWDRWLTLAADEIAKVTGLNWLTATIPVSVGVSSYVAPPIYSYEHAEFLREVADNVGLYIARSELTLETPASMDAGGDSWRDTPAGLPTCLITQAMTKVVLYPTPSMSGTLRVQGYARVGATWEDDCCECPLLPEAHPAVLYLAVLSRIIQFPTADNQARRPMIQERYELEKGRLERIARRLSEATKFPTYSED